MSTINRILVVSVALAAATGATVLLTYAGGHSQGPVAAILSRVGAGIGGAETAIVHMLRGNGRADDLSWLAPYHRDGGLLHETPALLVGAYDDGMPSTLEGVIELERSTGMTFPLLHLYTAWGDRPDQQFPLRIVRAIRDLGSIPVITWEPWLNDFDSKLRSHLPLPDDRARPGLLDVARGDYDFYIDRWAAAAAGYGETLFVRFGHEMNDPYRYPWGPQDREPNEFIGAWRHVVERFRAAGASNVLWVWSPHIAYDGYWQYYPGNDFVDWIATGVLNYGTVAQWSQWWTFDEIFERHYTDLAGAGKPLMIAEFGTLSAGGQRDEWYRRALTNLPDRMPAVRALLFFHAAGDATVTYQSLDWTITGDTALVEVVRDALAQWESEIPPETRR
ncbi:MAG TPA: glycosyl hydrolase [Longimicrobiales bacterium]|nr:glycosyl hydrolase [Longimicrobiales bacterium]